MHSRRHSCNVIVALAVAASAASAQTIPNLNAYPEVGYDSGSPLVAWLISNPTASGDRFSVDFNADLVGRDVVGMALDIMSTGTGSALGQVAFCRSNLGVDPSGATPDAVNGVLSGINGPSGWPGSSAGFCPGFVGIDLADFTAGSDVHAVMTFATGGTSLWLCGDNSPPAGRSYFTTNTYATPAIPFSVNWMIRAVTSGAPGTLSINTASVANVADDAALSFEFWGTAGTKGYLQGILLGSSFVAVPGFILPTGVYNFVAPGIGPDNGGISGSLKGICPPVGTSIDFAAFWIDPTMLKPNGHPTVRLTPKATLNVTHTSKSCCPLACFGVNDDGVLDGSIWKVGYPSGSGDWFDVKCGAVPAGVSNLLSMTALCIDTAGFGGTFKNAGVYPANPAIPGGNTPDPNNPLSAVGGASASVAPGGGLTVFDFPDVAAPVGSTIHVALQFQSGDTNLWMASDTDGTDDNASVDCGVIPNSTSFFSSNSFATTAVPLTFANAMVQLVWN